MIIGDRRKSNQKAEIEVDTKVLIEIEGKMDVEGNIDLLSLSSVVEEVESDGCLLVQMPIHKGAHYLLPRDKPLLVYSFIKQRMFSFRAQFQGPVKRENFLFAKLRPMSVLLPSQRRNCYRLQTSLPVAIDRLIVNDYGDTERTRNIGQMINISDSGMLLVTNENIHAGEGMTIHFDLQIPGLDRMETVSSKSLRSERIYGALYKYKIAVKFMNVGKGQRDFLYKYIVGKQREKMQQT